VRRHYTRRELLGVLAGGVLGGSIAAMAGAPPARTNRVISARLPQPADLDPGNAGKLLDQAIIHLTGADDPADAWCSLFSPADHVSIKVNCLGGPGMSTSPILVAALTERLVKCGIKPMQIIVWDRITRELKEAGYTVTRGGSEFQVYGTDNTGYSREIYENGSVGSLFSRILTDRCNKIINMPILKDHGICGMTFALKNYFGAIHNPNKYHLNRCNPYIGDLNAMKLIREREALIVGDLSCIQAEGGPSFKSAWAVPYGGVIVGRDPVAVDAAALTILDTTRKRIGRPDLKAKGLYPDYIEAAAETDAGSLEGIQHVEIEV
jgi:uncharacterized protein (DUF362 family)